MATSSGPLRTHEELALLKEEQEVERHDTRGKHELQIRIVSDWTVWGFTVLALVASFSGLVGWMQWPPGPVAPSHVLLSVVSAWVGKKLQGS